jgi:hypothetical protein
MKTSQEETEDWNEADLRYGAQSFWPAMIRGRTRYLELCESLRLRGFDGMVGSLSAAEVIDAWKKAGWVQLSPNRFEIRVTEPGKEQLEKWNEEDRLWNAQGTESMPLKKRLVAGEPARNLRKILVIIGNSTVTGIHDPYTTAGSLETILKLADIGAAFSPTLRILGTAKPLSNSTEKKSFLGLLKDANTERKSSWEARIYPAGIRPHRRFLILHDGSIVTCGMSLNHIDKDEVLDREPSGSENAKHDQQLFEDKWTTATPI